VVGQRTSPGGEGDAYLAWDELRRLRLITPTGTDLVNPTTGSCNGKGIAAIEGKDYAEYVEGKCS